MHKLLLSGVAAIALMVGSTLLPLPAFADGGFTSLSETGLGAHAGVMGGVMGGSAGYGAAFATTGASAFANANNCGCYNGIQTNAGGQAWGSGESFGNALESFGSAYGAGASGFSLSVNSFKSFGE